MRKSIFSGDPADPKVRARVGKWCGALGVGANALLFAGKLLAGMLTGSVAITADAMNNFSDTGSALVTLIGFKLAEKPADADHPYGHARYEYLSGLAVAALIIVIGVELGRSSLDKIFHPEAVSFSWVVALTLVLSIGVKLWLSLFNGKLSRLIHSSTLAATAQDSRNDVISTAAVEKKDVLTALYRALM
jgi:cation diffusion facilitator family transporter